MIIKSKNTDAALYRFLMKPSRTWDDILFCIKAMFSFFRNLAALKSSGPSICVVGSANYQFADNYYNKCAEEIGAIIAQKGFTTITGDVSGLMSWVYKGVYNVGGYSISLNTNESKKQGGNPYLHTEINVPYSFLHRVLLTKYSYACIVMPGGIDTLDELFEILSLSQLEMQRSFPVIVFGEKFYWPIKRQIEVMQQTGTLQINHPSNLFFTNSLDEVEYILQEYVVKHNKLKEYTR